MRRHGRSGLTGTGGVAGQRSKGAAEDPTAVGLIDCGPLLAASPDLGSAELELCAVMTWSVQPAEQEGAQTAL